MAEVVRKRERAESEQPRIEWSVSEHQVSAFLLGIGFQFLGFSSCSSAEY